MSKPIKLDFEPLFPLGRLVATPGAIEAMQDAGDAPGTFLSRHIRGDWGEVDADDKHANDNAVLDMTRILSAYRTAKGVKLWIITEADRSSTCILLPDEY
jgi:hypothetical protein